MCTISPFLLSTAPLCIKSIFFFKFAIKHKLDYLLFKFKIPNICRFVYIFKIFKEFKLSNQIQKRKFILSPAVNGKAVPKFVRANEARKIQVPYLDP